MKTAGVLFTFARPDYLEKALGSIEANTLAHEIDWFFYQDGLKDHPTVRSSYDNIKGEDLEKVTELLSSSPLKHNLIKREKNYGINYQMDSALKLFDEGYDTLFVMEDDLVVSKYYLNLLKQCSEEYPNMVNTFYSTNSKTAKNTQELRTMIWSAGYRYWGFYLTKEAFGNIRADWEAEYDEDKRAPFYDGILSRAVRRRTQGKFCSRFTRAYNVGREGILSYNPENWVTRGIVNQNEDHIEYEEDASLHGFVLR